MKRPSQFQTTILEKKGLYQPALLLAKMSHLNSPSTFADGKHKKDISTHDTEIEYKQNLSVALPQFVHTALKLTEKELRSPLK